MNFFGIPLSIIEIQSWEVLIKFTPSRWPMEERELAARDGLARAYNLIGERLNQIIFLVGLFFSVEERTIEYKKRNECFLKKRHGA